VSYFFTQYLKSIEANLQVGNATEHTHRLALQNLIQSLAQGVVATNEPKRIACGAPDYIVTKSQAPLGYIEAKDVDKSLDAVERSQQIKRYVSSLGNLILTNYLEFRWYVAGEHRLTARLATAVKGKRKLQPDQDGTEQVTALLDGFLNAKVPTVSSPKQLAERMARLAMLIRDTIRQALEDTSESSSLHQQLESFRKVLLRDLTRDEFSDMYEQTISYGMFAARCNAKSGQDFNRQNAAYNLPKTNPFLRQMFGNIAGFDLDERITWAVDDLAELMRCTDVESILQNFGKRTRQEDPIVHFYETFLAAYDPKLRKSRGVYYTPEPVVSYLVRSVDHILKTDFGLSDGLADATKIQVKTPDGKGTTESHKVLIADVATGTGAFLYGVIDHIYESFKHNQGMWSGYISQHLLPRLFGFELLMAPYTIAHLKLGLQLANLGYQFDTEERLRIYLTNTLQEGFQIPPADGFTNWIRDEADAAKDVKQEAPVMVVLGNPPYSVSSQNKGGWISELIEDYKKDLNEKKLNLDDDFIKFFRFAQWRIEQTGYGVLAFITNHTYLDGITHRRMRQSLMETFDDIYILDLHGNSKKKESCPNGSKDENVFDIQQGVAIGIFVKKPGTKKDTRVHYSELWGTRESKYKQLIETSVATTDWRQLKNIYRKSCLGSFCFFTPKAFDRIDEYCSGWSLKEIFAVQQNGLGTDRDNLFFDFERAILEERIKEFYSELGLSPEFRGTYRVENSSGYDLLSRRLKTTFDTTNIHQCLYRPFDSRWLYYNRRLTSRPAWDIMRHLVNGGNLALLGTRQISTDNFRHIFVSKHLVDRDPLSLATRERTQAFPLYLYPETQAERDMGMVRRPNFSPKFITDFASRLGMEFIPDGKGNRQQTFGPEDVFAYMYSVFHSPTYRQRYAEFLKIDFPRLPLTRNPDLFRDLCKAGDELVRLHLMEKHGLNSTSYPISGNHIVDKVSYTEPGQGAELGRVWINKTQYFEGVPPEVWNFHIGGYQVCQKWLKDRKGRQLTYDDLTHYQHIVSALSDTIRLMAEIDAVIEEHGGWPLDGSV
jgi:predicted helicase